MNMNSVPLESVVICKNESTANNNASPHHRSSSNNNNAKNDNDGKATNVQVCVRLRPLLESDFNKNNNNNDDNNNNTNTPRKSGGMMKRHTSGLATPSTTTIGGNRNKSSSIKKSTSSSNKNNHAEQQQQQNNNNSDIPSCCWTTYPSNLQRITQSIHTLDNMERKRHEAADYTFDRVYAPNESTNVLYCESIKSVVNSVVDGFHGSVFAYGQVRVYDMYACCCYIALIWMIPLCIINL